MLLILSYMRHWDNSFIFVFSHWYTQHSQGLLYQILNEYVYLIYFGTNKVNIKNLLYRLLKFYLKNIFFFFHFGFRFEYFGFRLKCFVFLSTKTGSIRIILVSFFRLINNAINKIVQQNADYTNLSRAAPVRITQTGNFGDVSNYAEMVKMHFLCVTAFFKGINVSF